MSDLYNFFDKTINDNGLSCNLPTEYLEDYSNCDTVDWFTYTYNADTGRLDIESTLTKVDDHKTATLFIDGTKQDFPINNRIFFMIDGLKTRDDIKFNYDIVLMIYDIDRSKGCTFYFDISFDLDNIGWEKDRWTYKIKYLNKPEYLLFDMSQFTYKWKVDNIVRSSLTGSQVILSDKVLCLMTDKTEVDVSVYIEELDREIYIGKLQVDRNKYNIQTTFEDVIVFDKMYANLNTTVLHGALDNIYYYIDNNLIQHDYFEYNYGGPHRKLQVVYIDTRWLNPNQQFDRTNLDTYESYIELDIDEKGFDISSYVDNVSYDGITNTLNPNKLIPLQKYKNKNYLSFLNKPKYIHSTNDEKYKIENNNYVIKDRVGRLYIELGKQYVVDLDLTPKEVTIDNLIDKQIIIVDEEALNIIPDAVSLDAYFHKQTPSGLQTDAHGWMYQPQEDMEMRWEKDVTNRIIQLQFSIKFNKTSSNKISKILLMFYTTNNEHIYVYGIEKLINGLMRLYDNDGTTKDLHQVEFEKQFVVMLTTRYNIEKFVIVMNNCKNDNMMIRDIVISEEK
jgi:hypothetical protein